MKCTFEQGGECGMHDNSGTGWVPERATQADHTTRTAQGNDFPLYLSNSSNSKIKRSYYCCYILGLLLLLL